MPKTDQCLQLGMVLEPGGASNQLVTGSSSGELKFLDFRMVDDSGHMGVWKTVEAHSKGGMTAIAAHPCSPLLATATANQVHGQLETGIAVCVLVVQACLSVSLMCM